jgi:hypothetical protein
MRELRALYQFEQRLVPRSPTRSARSHLCVPMAALIFCLTWLPRSSSPGGDLKQRMPR